MSLAFENILVCLSPSLSHQMQRQMSPSAILIDLFLLGFDNKFLTYFIIEYGDEHLSKFNLYFKHRTRIIFFYKHSHPVVAFVFLHFLMMLERYYNRTTI